MKYIAGGVLSVLALVAYMNVSVKEAYAFGTSQPFGWLISITVPGTSCKGGSGPFLFGAKSKSISTGYFFPSSVGTPSKGDWVLGFYDTAQDTSSCKMGSSAYPVYKVNFFGSSGSGGTSGTGSSFGGALSGAATGLGSSLLTSGFGN